jgi:hypothetical protein
VFVEPPAVPPVEVLVAPPPAPEEVLVPVPDEEFVGPDVVFFTVLELPPAEELVVVVFLGVDALEFPVPVVPVVLLVILLVVEEVFAGLLAVALVTEALVLGDVLARTRSASISPSEISRK